MTPNAPTQLDLSKLRVAIVHYWFIGRAGGEKVVEAITEIFPQADIFTLVVERSTLAPSLSNKKIVASFLQRIPGARRFHRHFLPLQPLALEQFDLSNYDLVISSESGPAKGVITSSKTCHICYCHSPMRYIWDMYSAYRREMGFLVRLAFTVTAHYIRLWDYASAARVDYFVANSSFIASRIRKYYGRESTVINPPVQAAAARIARNSNGYYLLLGRLVDYKRFDIAIEACNRLGRPLKVVGSGPQLNALRQIAGRNVEFHDHANDSEVSEYLSNCRALLFPGEEDFGIVPVEAQSFGKPVIAYASGGALETIRGVSCNEEVTDSTTGVFFHQQSTSALVDAIRFFESQEEQFSPERIREHSLQFDAAVFKRRMTEFVLRAMEQFRSEKISAISEEPSLQRSYLS